MSSLPEYSIVWAELPCITAMCPCVGHYGITDSKGTVYDFGGPYFVNESKTQTIFGRPVKYLEIKDITVEQKANWDSYISRTKVRYEKKWYDFFCNNCHHFVAAVLNSGGIYNKKWSCCGLLCRTRCQLQDIKKFDERCQKLADKIDQ